MKPRFVTSLLVAATMSQLHIVACTAVIRVCTCCSSNMYTNSSCYAACLGLAWWKNPTKKSTTLCRMGNCILNCAVIWSNMAQACITNSQEGTADRQAGRLGAMMPCTRQRERLQHLLAGRCPGSSSMCDRSGIYVIVQHGPSLQADSKACNVGRQTARHRLGAIRRHMQNRTACSSCWLGVAGGVSFAGAPRAALALPVQ